ncbi:hypothetical protein IW261DRAFT_1006008 [Armillaria novae-zelandiae]|uniref:Uncharacterized protein n=1 Tax=Armillaria novae-zelandiae TaxID=153914 RepID=A0AA39U9G3_9AGAR|nr:hypothetical protein IW261DRAFT_1006008 [Armillaria novae-zelandiae]
MTFLFSPLPSTMNPTKRSRRSATSVMAGAFQIRPSRDVLTSLLNGLGPYTVEEEGKLGSTSKQPVKNSFWTEKDPERRKTKHGHWQKLPIASPAKSATPVAHTSTVAVSQPEPSTFCRRPTIHIATMQRSLSITPPPTMSPPPYPSTPGSTPGPSDSSSVSRTSSKRPHTPDDDEDLPQMVAPRPPRKKRVAVKKGWKGWVELDESRELPVSDKLINLDRPQAYADRRTRSGKQFDGIVGDSWVHMLP